MDRRLFLNRGTLAALTTALLPMAACQPTTENTKGEAAAPPTTAGSDDGSAFALHEATVTELQDRMAKGTETARSLSEKYLARIKEVNEQGPMLRAVIETNPDALKIADELDKERKAGKVRGPMHGIPVLIKDNIDSGDQMMTTAGALALSGHKAKQDAFIVQKLRAAGAVLLGKTNLSEWANFRSTRSVSGWSSRGRQSRNPYALDRNTSGSSSGSGAAPRPTCAPWPLAPKRTGRWCRPRPATGWWASSPRWAC
ncbi:amidase family protein [Hymenobacter lapidarius]|uniref:amidase family protein n=1 Tax=Hymenobacter lapidarius TaxID=1908237 RepID=UPI000ACD29AD|nr:amidase family protein [Hymenobacter lapidarius]